MKVTTVRHFGKMDHNAFFSILGAFMTTDQKV